MEKPSVEKVTPKKTLFKNDKNLFCKLFSGLIAFLSALNIVWWFLPSYNVTNYHKISVFDLFLALIGQKAEGTLESFMLTRTELKPITILIIFMSVILLATSVYLIVVNLINIFSKKHKFENNSTLTCAQMITALIVIAGIVYSTILWASKKVSLINNLLIYWPIIVMAVFNIGSFVLALLIQKYETLKEQKRTEAIQNVKE